MIVRSPLILSSLILGFLLANPHFCYGMELDKSSKEHRLLRKLCQDSRELFKIRSSSPPQNSVVNANPLPNKDFDEWSSSDDEEEKPKNSRFSLPTRSRSQNMRKKMEMGHSPEELQRTSNDWYTRNRMRCFDADQLLRKQKEGKAYKLIEKASEDGFPGATFELTKQALTKNQKHKAKLYFRKTCEQLRDKGHLLDNQYRDDALLKGIKLLVSQNPILEEVLNDFKEHSYFQMEQNVCIKESKAIGINPALLKYAENTEEDDEIDDLVDQVSLKLQGLKTNDLPDELELIFEDE